MLHTVCHRMTKTETRKKRSESASQSSGHRMTKTETRKKRSESASQSSGNWVLAGNLTKTNES